MKKIMKKNKGKNAMFLYRLLCQKGFYFGFGLLLVIAISLLNAFSLVESLFSKILVVLLIIFGFLIGYKNIDNKETVGFLLSSIVIILFLPGLLQALIQVFALSDNQTLLVFLSQIFSNLNILIVPATLVVALKNLFLSAKN